MKRVVLNTDIFGDPDDIYALLFLLASPEIKIEMIITSDEKGCGRAKATKQLLSDLGKDIPVYCGEDLGHTKLYFAPESQQEVSKDYRKAIENISGDFTFLSIGPLSELANVIDILKERNVPIILMGGSTQKDEHNVKYDEAAAIKVLQSGANVKWVSCDITLNDRIKIDAQHPLYAAIMKSSTPAGQALKKNTDDFYNNLYPSNYLHDPLAISIIIDDSLVQFEEKNFELKNSQFFPSPQGFKVNYGVKADYDRFLKLFNERIMQWL